MFGLPAFAPAGLAANKKERAGRPALDHRLTPKPELLRRYLVRNGRACKIKAALAGSRVSKGTPCNGNGASFPRPALCNRANRLVILLV
jgi:hypothetical protein